MADINRDGILDEMEAHAYRERAAKAKFKQMISYGVGAAMVFGLFSALAAGLVKGITWTGLASFTSSSFLLPALGLAGIAVLGVGCLFLSAKYLSENTLLDQAMQAKQINVAQGKTQETAKTVEEEKPAPQFPSAMASKTEETATEVSQTNWADKFTSRADVPLLAKNDNEKQSWAEKAKPVELSGNKPQLAAL